MTLILALAIIGFAAAFHAYWAVGGRLGLSVSLPQSPDGTPVMAHRLSWWRPAAGGIALCLACLALLLLSHAGHLRLPLPPEWVCLALLLIGLAFVCRPLIPNRHVGFFKTLRTTRWARYDTRLYSPLFLLLGLLILWQATTEKPSLDPSGLRVDRIIVHKARHEMILLRGGRIVRRYRVALGRGGLGPKQMEGDNKVPEGRYRIAGRNAASAYHLSLKIGYPTAAQSEQARRRAAALAEKWLPIAISLAGLGIFPATPATIWAAPVVTEPLLGLHASLIEAFEDLPVDEHYRRDAWVPHVTLSMRGPALTAEAVEILSALWQAPVACRLETVELIKFPPVEIVWSRGLSGAAG